MKLQPRKGLKERESHPRCGDVCLELFHHCVGDGHVLEHPLQLRCELAPAFRLKGKSRLHYIYRYLLITSGINGCFSKLLFAFEEVTKFGQSGCHHSNYRIITFICNNQRAKFMKRVSDIFVKNCDFDRVEVIRFISLSKH